MIANKKCNFLICTIRLDPHADAVMKVLEDKGESVFRINTEDFYEKYSFSLKQNETENSITIINNVNGKYIQSSNYKIPAYYRKPSNVTPSTLCPDENSREISSREADSFLKMLYASDLFYWINDKFNNIRASRKNWQIEIAKKIGLKFPNTIITTNKKDAVEFYESKKGKVIIKPLAITSYIDESEFYSIFAEKLDKNTFYSNLDSIKVAPAFLQEYVEKQYELRICVFGNKVFACKLNSQENEKTKVDWRVVSPYEIKHKIIEIPEKLKNQLIEMNSELNLDFGIYDFIYTPNDEYYFLENNPNGQWYWIEILTKAEMADAMAKLLEINYCQHYVKNHCYPMG